MSKHTLRSSSLLLFCAPLASCASYAVPGRPADLSIFMKDGELDPVRQTDERPVGALGLEELLARRPMAAFPSGVAVARIQAPGYGEHGAAHTAGLGSFTIVTSRTAEEVAAFERLSALPMVAGIAPVNRLLVPDELSGDLELRRIAARLHADMLLVYTLDTSTVTDELSSSFLLGLLTLGVYVHQETELVCTGSAVLLDTRTGYVYGTAEASTRREKEHSLHGAADRIERERERIERATLEELAADLERTWNGVVAVYAPTTSDSPRGTQ
jgi:hypothetical protein